VDRIDQSILALLSRDGRISFTDIGRELGLSTSAAQQRVRRIEAAGVISGYTARVNPNAVGRTLAAFVSIRVLSSEQDETVRSFMESAPEVVGCCTVAGDADFWAKVMVRDSVELEAFINRLRNAASVLTVTTVVLTTLFNDRPLVDLPPEAPSKHRKPTS
jgi:Lrp/AsnC family leucine-responsive transcriptional regulator